MKWEMFQEALNLLKSGLPLDELPEEPSGIAKTQWENVCKISREAILLFETYAVLGREVDDNMITHFTGLDTKLITNIRSHVYLRPLLKEGKNAEF